MASLTRRGFGLAGMGAALASAGAVRPAGASNLLNPLTSPRGTTHPGRVRLKQIASVDFRKEENAFAWHVSSMAWSPDGSRLVAESAIGNFLNVFDTASWQLLARFRVMQAKAEKLFGFSEGGRELIASRHVPPGSSENPPAFSVFETDTGRMLRESDLLPVFLPDILARPQDLFLQQRRSAQSLTVSPDGRYVFISFWATGIRGNTTRRFFAFVFDSKTGRLLGSGEGRYWGMPSVSHDNRLAVATNATRLGYDNEIAIFDLPSLKERIGFQAHDRGVRSLAWSPDGSRLASGSSATVPPREAEPIRVWDATSGARLAGFIGEFEPVSFVEWHPSGAFFLTKSAKGDENLRGSLVQFLSPNGGAPLLKHFAPDRVVINGPCFCPRTGRLAWFQQGQILIHEIQGL
jgi:WD40 repeat protein